MAIYTEVVQNTETVIELAILPASSRTRTEYTFTVSNAGTAVSSGATTIPIVAAPVALYVGDQLTFGAVTVTLTANAASGATSLTVAATSGSIADAATATTYAMRKLTGADTANLSFSSESVDVSSFGDGITKEMLKVAAGWSFEVSGTYTSNPAVEEVLYPLGSNGALAKREVYVVVTYGNGDTDEGVAQVMNYTESVALRDAKKFSCTLEGRATLTRTLAA